MNLSDTTIKWHFDTLFPAGKGDNDSIDRNKQIQPSTVDLRLGRIFYRMADTARTNTRINPRIAVADDFFRCEEVEGGKPFVLKPGPENFVLGQTMEYVSVPDALVGFVDGRSSYGRWGLRIHSTAGLIDAGFQGIITLEISLDSVYEMEIYPGDRICQIRFEQLDQPARRPYGHESRGSKYQGQVGTTPSRSNKDGET
jgi:dCTP deaminase